MTNCTRSKEATCRTCPMMVRMAPRKMVLRRPMRSEKKVVERAPIRAPIWNAAMTAPLLVELWLRSAPSVLTVSISGNWCTQLCSVARGPSPAWLYPKTIKAGAPMSTTWAMCSARPVRPKMVGTPEGMMEDDRMWVMCEGRKF
ncbi:hypothetical protein BJX65DRAFT_290244 [Aspergillus insuetus]